MKNIRVYLKIMRLDHWIKQLFIFPGTVAAFVLINLSINSMLFSNICWAFLSTCFIASSNYVINEWLDAAFDKYHPVKKHRSVVENGANPVIVYTLYFALAILGIICSSRVSKYLVAMELWLWVMGILYNVKPFRTKDIVYVDVLTESINNAIRLLIGWFAVTGDYLPPISLVIGYWFAGAFLMATKRFSEYRMINDPQQASLYRKSFKYYTQNSLLISAFFYALSSTFFIGIFLIKYRVELILFVPAFIGLFCYYFTIAFKEDSAAQKPEKLFKEKGLMIYVLLLVILFALLMKVDIPALNKLISDDLIIIH